MSADRPDSDKRLRRRVREWTTPLGLDDLARSAYVASGRLGERLWHGFAGRPGPGDARLLVGGGRSGSTWVADILCSGTRVQQLFEPLHPVEVAEVQALTGWQDTGRPHIRSFYLRPDGEYPAWEDFLGRMLAGDVRSYWTDAERTSWLPRHYLVKLIRGNLLIGYLIDRFAPRVAFLVRHPGAVVASRLAAGWHADVRDILAQEELVEDHLRPWIHEIERERDLLGAHAVWWAVENRVAALQLSTRPHVFQTYEAILANPLEEMTRMARALEIDAQGLGRVDFSVPSRMASTGASGASAGPRAQAWRRKLGDDQSERILAWSRRLGVDWYDEEGRPRVRSGRVPRPPG